MTSANLLVVLLISTVVGALVGLGLGGVITHPLLLGVISGFLATILAGVARNYLVSRTQRRANSCRRHPLHHYRFNGGKCRRG